ncbi:MAG: DnaA/Hda family protein, partial [Pseudomonadota bacterium]
WRPSKLSSILLNLMVDHSSGHQYNGGMRQIALPLFDPSICSFSDVIVHPGISESLVFLQSALAEISRSNPDAKRILLHGPSGSGKTMLLRASVEYFKNGSPSIHQKCFFVSLADRKVNEPSLETLARLDHEQLSLVKLVCIDDVDKISEQEPNHLWSLWNRLMVVGAHLICSSSVGPEDLFVENSHLRSRMLAGLSLELTAPNDNERILVLDKMASRRGIKLTHDVINYLLSRKSRNLKKLEDMLNLLDEASLSERRRVTVRLIKDLEIERSL